MQKTIIPQTTTTVYDIGVRELHRISTDETARKQIDHELNESRGRETARLHVTLTELNEARLALANQADGSLQSLSSQQRENTERLAVDVRKLRDEVVSLVDSRMNQADASFAALRGDVEVVKYLVMDLIKDRIGRND